MKADNMQKLSTQPQKGFRDFLPKDMKVQNYIFNTWRQVCLSYGYEEYNGPILESSAIYNKSGDEVGTGGKELYTFEDKGGRSLSLRPEMTPTVGRMIAEYGSSLSKPIRWFSIAQFFRAEKPQKGRGREFFQLNADIFGSESGLSDLEIIKLSIDIMLKFGGTEEMFKVKINNRKFIDYYFDVVLGVSDKDQKRTLIKLIDASGKKEEGWLKKEVLEMQFDEVFYKKIEEYLDLEISDLEKFASDSEGAKELMELFQLLEQVKYSKYCQFDTSISRGLDYYTGMVFEVFDKTEGNTRSMFGGGRYDDLLGIFGKPKMPAVGVAPGDMTTRLFLESWGLLKDIAENSNFTYYIPLLSESLYTKMEEIASDLRSKGESVEVGLEVQNVSKALSYADKKGIAYVVLLGDEELSKNIYKIKDMKSREETEYKL